MNLEFKKETLEDTGKDSDVIGLNEENYTPDHTPNPEAIDRARACVEQRVLTLGWNDLLTNHIEIVDRLAEIEFYSRHNQDAWQMIGILDLLIYEWNNSHLATETDHITVEEEKVIKRVFLVHDIGKSGPVGVDINSRRVVLSLYGLDAPIPDQNATSIENVISRYFGQNSVDARFRLEPNQARVGLNNCGVDTNQSIRSYYDKHAYWGLEILGKHFPKDIAEMAGSHHILNGINPAQLSRKEMDLGIKMITLMSEYNDALMLAADPLQMQEKDIPIKMLNAIDIYQAVLRRGGGDHNHAILVLRRLLNNSEYADDEEMLEIICLLDKLGKK